MKQNLIKIVKAIGLMALVFVTNLPPMLFLQYQKAFSLGLSCSLAILYVVLVMVIVVFLWKYYHRLQPSNLSIKWRDIGFAFLWLVSGRVIAIAGTIFIRLVSGRATSANDAGLLELGKMMKGGFLPFAILYILVIAVIAPIVEELIFRGNYIQLLFNGSTGWLSWLVTTGIFAFLHSTTILEILFYFAVGSVLFVAYARRGEIKESIFVHFLNNLLAGIYMLTLLF
ncbi:CPBP family intramembrane metalloprotease [Streptococcus sp. X16XC17]|uniref:CPBP family intramembrane glutamic endopeptidase n=1 Tax=Streptococcus sp. X16XC17 TaxID=2316646 RepID=UPI00103B9575|nr:type II CAAX endopeptidase family protein [Streptococcus sp. X16XC17]TCD45726.1 CPBP family intramembrane metalloprotease [Streptococcus sp. X16XC17]